METYSANSSEINYSWHKDKDNGPVLQLTATGKYMKKIYEAYEWCERGSEAIVYTLPL